MQGFIQDFVLGNVRGKCVGDGHRRAVVRIPYPQQPSCRNSSYGKEWDSSKFNCTILCELRGTSGTSVTREP